MGEVTADLQHHQVRAEEEPSSRSRRPQVLRLHGQRTTEVPQLLLRSGHFGVHLMSSCLLGYKYRQVSLSFSFFL